MGGYCSYIWQFNFQKIRYERLHYGNLGSIILTIFFIEEGSANIYILKGNESFTWNSFWLNSIFCRRDFRKGDDPTACALIENMERIQTSDTSLDWFSDPQNQKKVLKEFFTIPYKIRRMTIKEFFSAMKSQLTYDWVIYLLAVGLV